MFDVFMSTIFPLLACSASGQADLQSLRSVNRTLKTWVSAYLATRMLYYLVGVTTGSNVEGVELELCMPLVCNTLAALALPLPGVQLRFFGSSSAALDGSSAALDGSSDRQTLVVTMAQMQAQAAQLAFTAVAHLTLSFGFPMGLSLDSMIQHFTNLVVLEITHTSLQPEICMSPLASALCMLTHLRTVAITGYTLLAPEWFKEGGMYNDEYNVCSNSVMILLERLERLTLGALTDVNMIVVASTAAVRMPAYMDIAFASTQSTQSTSMQDTWLAPLLLLPAQGINAHRHVYLRHVVWNPPSRVISMSSRMPNVHLHLDYCRIILTDDIMHLLTSKLSLTLSNVDIVTCGNNDAVNDEYWTNLEALLNTSIIK